MVLAPVCLHAYGIWCAYNMGLGLGTVWIITSPRCSYGMIARFETRAVRPFFVFLRVDSFALDLALACGVCMVKCSSRDNVLDSITYKETLCYDIRFLQGKSKYDSSCVKIGYCNSRFHYTIKEKYSIKVGLHSSLLLTVFFKC